MASNRISFPELTREMMRLYTEGKFEAALNVVERHAAEFPEEAVRLTFWRMCLLSLNARPQDALSLFEAALDEGLWWHESQFRDSDLDPVRELPEFKCLVGISRERYEQAQANFKPERVLLVPDEAAQRYPLVIALHGRSSNMRSHISQWEAARRRGWMVLLPQSGQVLFPGGYRWDDPVKGLQDIKFYLEEVLGSHAIDPDSILLAGFSQGGGMALYAALSGEVPVRGYIGVGPWWENVADLAQMAARGHKPHAYFVVGQQDQGLARIREMQEVLRANGIPLDEEIHGRLGHEFPPDFAMSFEKAIGFISP